MKKILEFIRDRNRRKELKLLSSWRRKDFTSSLFGRSRRIFQNLPRIAMSNGNDIERSTYTSEESLEITTALRFFSGLAL